MGWAISDSEIAALVGEMTATEKVDLLNGHGLWRTAANYRLNIPELIMTDGTYGVRYSSEQIDGVLDDKSQFEQFFSVVNTGQGDDPVETTFGSSKPATCFPNGSSFACAWDIDLAYELGAALAEECQAYGVNLLLGPGINIRRTPLAGRSYEYYSEDPLLTGEIAAGVIAGLQDNGVGAALKHFACNNSEVQRTSMSSEVSERALREIYFAGFERAIAKSDPWMVMSSYNRLNGIQAAENRWLLTEVLRGEWGYEGVVVSDWHGIKDRPASLLAGNDLDMPESGARKAELERAIADGQVPMSAMDAACDRVLKLVRKGRDGARSNVASNFENHHALAQRMAAESVVLLKNEGGILPLAATGLRIAVVGTAAIDPVIQGSGCATTRPTRVDIPLEDIRKLAGADARIELLPTDTEAAMAASLEAASAADAVIFFGNTEVGYDGEGSDRTHLHLEGRQDELIARFAAANPRTVVVLAIPDAVEMPWLDAVAGVLVSFFPGQGGGFGVAQVLFGAHNPSGKLTVTFPARLQDTPGFLTYPGENGRHVYSEGLFVGYRYYDKRSIAPLFPFGFGLSYTRFAYANIAVREASVGIGDTIDVSFDLTNTGARAGKEVVQLYARVHAPRLSRPVRELKSFAKVSLEPGETRRITMSVPVRDLRYYDDAHGQWLLDSGVTTIEIASSSRDVELEVPVTIAAPTLVPTRLTVESQPYLILGDSGRRAAFSRFLQTRLQIDAAESEKLLDYCATSFLGIYNTLSWIVEERISRSDMADFLETLNRTAPEQADAAA